MFVRAYVSMTCPHNKKTDGVYIPTIVFILSRKFENYFILKEIAVVPYKIFRRASKLRICIIIIIVLLCLFFFLWTFCFSLGFEKYK